MDHLAIGILDDLLAAPRGDVEAAIVQGLRALNHDGRFRRTWFACRQADGQTRLLTAPDGDWQDGDGQPDLVEHCLAAVAPGCSMVGPGAQDAVELMALHKMMVARGSRSFALIRGDAGLLVLEADQRRRCAGVAKSRGLHLLAAAMGRLFEAQAEIKAQRVVIARTRSTLAALPSLVFEVSEDGRFLAGHGSRVVDHPMRPEDLIGRTVEEVLPPTMAQTRRMHMREAHEKGMSTPERFVMPTPGGPRHLEITVSRREECLATNDSGFIFFIRDIRDQIGLEKQLNRLADVAQRTSNLVVIADAQMRVQWVNNAFERRSGYTLAEMYGTNPGQLLQCPETDPAVRTMIRDALRARLPVQAEILNQSKSGERYWLQLDIQPLIEADGECAGFVAVQTDITDFKAQRAEVEATSARLRTVIAELRDTELRFASIAEISRSWVWEQDADLRFTYLSKGYQNLTGFDASTLFGKTRQEVVALSADTQRSADWEVLNRCIAARQPFSDFIYQAASINPPGRKVWVQISGKPVFSAEGEFCGYRGVGADVTVLRETISRAEEASRAKSTFLATMSHEIRTPLNGILGMAEMLDDVLAEPHARSMLTTIRESGETLLSILNDLLDLAKIEAGKLNIETIVFQPLELAARLEATYGLRAQGKGISFATNSDRGLANPRLGDPTRILQVLHNLLGNAIKFTEKGEISLRFGNGPDDTLVIEVQDTGIGMTPEQITRVFRPFEQAEQGTTRRFGGTGLGLSITSDLVKLMGGSIIVSSNVGIGTTIRVTLPCPRADILPPAPTARLPEKVQSPLGRGLHVLVADDNATNRLIMKSMLTSLGVGFTMSNDGAEAVATWTPGAFDVLLLDISMPVLDGAGALQAIREKALAKGCPRPVAIAVTANAMAHQISEYIDAGFDLHLSKPVRRDALHAALAAILPQKSVP